MFKSPEIIVGLEIGTSKICAVVGEINAAGAISVIGVGQSRSRGVRKGEVVDGSLAEEDIRNAVAEAEQMADVEIRSVFLGVTGAHIQGSNNRGIHTVLSADREITEEDVQDVIKNAKAITLPADHHVIHAVRQHFMVDEQTGILNPVGMLGTRLDVDMHVVHGKLNRLQNPIRLVKGLQLEVEDIAFNGLASSLAVLTSEQKELGSLVIDLGGGTTEYVVYADGVIKLTGVLAVGGDHMSNDLAIGLKVPLGRAEQLKIDQGRAMVDGSVKGQCITLPGEAYLPEKKINLEHLRLIMHLRLEEIFEIIARRVSEAGLLDYLRAGVVLCGGGVRTPQIQELADGIFHLPACLGRTHSLGGIRTALDQPEFATAIGLVKYGAGQIRRRSARTAMSQGFRQTVRQWFRGDRRSRRPSLTQMD
ncbi:MAG TPA: cell division protein FtsA [Candidatus Paceibacterota bacterium]|nr:cell division protein FtsA [Verrucomicrobiota bacterium]HRY48455.1 cell division protein FtsA [Candidatus Paceibacterota bacterium]